MAVLGVVCLGLQAQGLPVGSRGTLSYEQSWQKQIEKKILQSARERKQNMTVEAVINGINKTGKADACMIAAIVADKAYLQTLDVSERDALIEALGYVDPKDGTGCGFETLVIVTNKLEHAAYNEAAEDFPLNALYYEILLSFGLDDTLYKQAYNWAFEQADKASLRASDGYGGMWAALALNEWAVLPESLMARREFESRLEKIIGQFDWLKDQEADYESRLGHFTTKSGENMDVIKLYKKALKQELLVLQTPFLGAKNAQSVAGLFNAKTNQAVLLSLFAQVNNVFAYQDEHLIPGKVGNVAHELKGWFVGGAFNECFRRDDSQRFSDKGENFLFHSPTPGTDGRGQFANSANGRKHQIMGQLIYALVSSYENRSNKQEGARLAKQFVHRYLSVNGAGEFEHYLGIALQGMRAGKEVFFATDIQGWDQEAAALEEELDIKLVKGYSTVYDALTSMQGGAETILAVKGIWPIVGEVFFAPFKLAGKGISKAWVKHMPKRTRVVLRQTLRRAKTPAIVTGASVGAAAVNLKIIEKRQEKILEVQAR